MNNAWLPKFESLLIEKVEFVINSPKSKHLSIVETQRKYKVVMGVFKSLRMDQGAAKNYENYSIYLESPEPEGKLGNWPKAHS